MMNKRFLNTLEASKLIKTLRRGGLIEIASALVLIVVMCQIMGVGI